MTASRRKPLPPDAPGPRARKPLSGALTPIYDQLPHLDRATEELVDFCLARIDESERLAASLVPDSSEAAWAELLDSLGEGPVAEWIRRKAKPHPGWRVLELGAARGAVVQSYQLPRVHRWQIAKDVAVQWAHHPDFRPEWLLKGDEGWERRMGR